MRKRRSADIFLQDILTASTQAQEFIDGMSEEEFYEDVRTQFAIIRCLEIIGEASHNLPSELKDAYPEVEWRAIKSTRNLLIHDYTEVDIKAVWNVVKEDLPRLFQQIREIANEV